MHKEATLQCIRPDALNTDWSDLQVRQLQSIGFGVSRDILAEVDTANKFYRHGLLLKQVVNFYNNSATEIIPCQKPMLLQVRPTANFVAGAYMSSSNRLPWSVHARPNVLQSIPSLHPLAEALPQAIRLVGPTLLVFSF